MSVDAGSLVVVGGGMTAGRLLRRLAELGCRRPITLISDEHALPYNRVLLPDVLSGRCAEQDLALKPPSWYRERQIRFLGGRRVSGIDPAARRVICTDGTVLGYRDLVLATGARVPKPEVPGLNLPGVTELRNLSDAREIRDGAPAAEVCVVGGGLLGLETARSLAALGAKVRIVHRAQRLLNRQLDARGSAMVRAFLEELGIECVLGETVTAIEGDATVRSVRLTGGAELPARWVIFATGTRPDDRLAAAAGLATDGGILTGEGMETSDPHIYAIGECARVSGTAHAMVDPVYRQADVLADRLCGGSMRFSAPPPATRLKVAGLAVFAAGSVSEVPGADDLIIEDPARKVYRRYCYLGDVLAGAVLVGDSSGSNDVQVCLQSGGKVSDPVQLAFGAPAEAA